MKLIDKAAVVAEIEKRVNSLNKDRDFNYLQIKELEALLSSLDTLEVKEVDNVWHEVDNVNLPQPDKNKIYCVLSKNKYLLARVINHPHDELLQWKCTEFPFHRYDMCEGDMYMEITNAQKGV